ncbi:VOC family protein [Chondromyces apiculatus]|uniref:VOC domain-containing protein n=1 Tax=Chondromyces apiculatus DSM 436 TaxID=1192034 RepID=A0A017TD55_9BACT|nr:VOC family protein [Chondromyces apiculatus]EYF07159.1 Hypothetical protein CAP_0638 [Chondromyces apiculatus DSM 436]
MPSFSHLELNVTDLDRSIDFYLSALSPLGFVLADSERGQYARLTNGRDAVLILCPVAEAYRDRPYHRKAVGLSHLAFGVESHERVDEMIAHLAQLGIPLLGEGKISSDYRRGYCTIAFEDPDRIMIEIVHHDPHYFAVLL